MYKHLRPALQLFFFPLTDLGMHPHLTCISTSPCDTSRFHISFCSFCWDICYLSYELAQLLLILQDSAEAPSGLRSSPELSSFLSLAGLSPSLGISYPFPCTVLSSTWYTEIIINVCRRHYLPCIITVPFSLISVTTSYLACRKQSGKAC